VIRPSSSSSSAPRLPRLAAMTLIEVLAVVVILGLLAVTLTVGISAKFGRAKTEIARTQIAEIVAQLQAFQLEKHALPSNADGLGALSATPGTIYYLEPGKLLDPWGNPYHYLNPGPNGAPFEVVSYGADNQVGGDGENQDISSAGTQGGH
jgi:general secretion pathway protein G